MNHEWTILEYDRARDRIKKDTVGIKVIFFKSFFPKLFVCSREVFRNKIKNKVLKFKNISPKR